MATYTYTGKMPANFTHRTKDDKGKFTSVDVRLSPGETKDIDDSLPVVQSFIKRGLLKKADSVVVKSNDKK